MAASGGAIPFVDKPIFDASDYLVFEAGSDLAEAQRLGFVGAVRWPNDGGAFELGLNGVSGGRVVVDDVARIIPGPRTAEFALVSSAPVSGSLAVEAYEYRLWTGDHPPTSRDDANVCSWLDLATAQQEGTCSEAAHLQVVIELGPNAQGAASVDVRPHVLTRD